MYYLTIASPGTRDDTCSYNVLFSKGLKLTMNFSLFDKFQIHCIIPPSICRHLQVFKVLGPKLTLSLLEGLGPNLPLFLELMRPRQRIYNQISKHACSVDFEGIKWNKNHRRLKLEYFFIKISSYITLRIQN